MTLQGPTVDTLPADPLRSPGAPTQQEVAELAVLADRQRIAEEIRDGAMRRLFSLGLAVAALRSRVSDDLVRYRLDQIVSGLDQTIDDLRTSIFELSADSGRGGRHPLRRGH